MSAEAENNKYEYGPGPWSNEPNRLEFEEYGLPCLMHRNPLGAWCGYVAVPPGHPYYGKKGNDLEVHGGVTYADYCSGHVCHTPKEGQPDNVWWFGFDCAHCWDLVPWMVAQKLKLKWPVLDEAGTVYVSSPNAELDELEAEARLFAHDVYRDVEYVKGQCRYLAEQLKEAEASP